MYDRGELTWEPTPALEEYRRLDSTNPGSEIPEKYKG
jgi:hypothetical protein